jgi:hypothetical protein
MKILILLFILVFVIFFLDYAAAMVPHLIHILMVKKMDAKFIYFNFEITTVVASHCASSCLQYVGLVLGS